MTDGEESGGESDAHDDGSRSREDARRDCAHLADLPTGAGCTEIWEHLADRREE